MEEDKSVESPKEVEKEPELVELSDEEGESEKKAEAKGEEETETHDACVGNDEEMPEEPLDSSVVDEDKESEQDLNLSVVCEDGEEPSSAVTDDEPASASENPPVSEKDTLVEHPVSTGEEHPVPEAEHPVLDDEEPVPNENASTDSPKETAEPIEEEIEEEQVIDYSSVFATLGSTINGDFGESHLAKMQKRLQKWSEEKPDEFIQYTNNPLTRSLLKNPQIVRDMIFSNDSMRKFVHSLPEVENALANPDFLVLSKELAEDPPMLKRLIKEQGGRAKKKRGAEDAAITLDEEDIESEEEKSPEPVTTTTEEDDVLSLHPSLAEFQQTMLKKVIQNPHHLRNMVNSPYFQAATQSFANSSELYESVVNSVPYFGLNSTLKSQLKDMTPEFMSQLQNKQTQDLLKDPNTMQAMFRIQEGMQELHNLTPDLFPSMKACYSQSPVFRSSAEVVESATMKKSFPWVGAGLENGFYKAFAETIANAGEQRLESAKVKPEVRYKTELAELKGMGFKDRKINLAALVMTNGELAEAVERIAEMTASN